MISTGLHIARPTGLCAAGGQPLEPGEPIVAVLTEHPESDELSRFDFTLQAWKDGARPQAPHTVFACWQTVQPEPNAKPKLLIDNDSLLDLFEQLAEQEDRRRQAFRYVLAWMLIRKRLLVYEQSRDGMLMVRRRGTLRPPEGPPLIEVADPGLDNETVAMVMDQLTQVMAGGAE